MKHIGIKMSDKIPIINETEVKGNIKAYSQTYSFSFLPRIADLPEKMELQVKTDVFNTIRFELENPLWEFVENSFLAYIKFLELKINPEHKEQFRMTRLDYNLKLLRNRIISEWRKHENIKYQKHIVY